MKDQISPKKRVDWTLWTILLIGLLFRVLFLALKAPHFDEGINGWFVDQMISQGLYRYDPTNYHGPLHFYILLIFKILFGRNLWALRLSASLFGVASLYLMAQFKEYLGRFTAYTATFFAAISPGMVFYSRYAIHETELLFFSLLAVLGFFRFKTRKDKTSLWQMAIGISGMVVTKETFLVHIICFSIAWAVLRILEHFKPSLDTLSFVEKKYVSADVTKIIFISILIIVTLYSGFFLNWSGVADLLLSFKAWVHTGQQGNGHQKPFFYWFELLTRYEWIALAGLIVTPKLIFPTSRWVRLLGIYGVGIFLAYSIVPYKTPWCVINIIWPLLFVAAGVFSEFAKHGVVPRNIALFALLSLSVFDFQKTISLNFYHFEDEKEPYVYVQSFSPIMGLNEKIQDLAKKDLSLRDEQFLVLMESSWPIPWLLGDFTKGYFAKPIPPNPDSLFIFADASIRAELESKLKNSYYRQTFKLRSSQAETVAYFDAKVFKEYFPKNSEIFIPSAVDNSIPPGAGLEGKFYGNVHWTGPVTFTQRFKNIDFGWDADQRPWPFPLGIVFSGQIFIPTDELIVYSLTSDDGSVLLIDGHEVIDNLGEHAAKTVTQELSYSKGWHRIELKYNDVGGGMLGRLMWKLPDKELEPIDVTHFRLNSPGEKQ